ncbi:hypothetical protein PM10SUCC1_10080 [Propionigenium maris DSM 9537]|uniref:Uncharacterized protein n=1 Tax=Propionigenium maris DSM 9537 TaxID=1123000 RepID=A0A9W6GHV8_9FUSO|nr:hypothetical protein [Propionigenium maris]GLI55494.1 hypothetical protein PM10SUCC1_10080 [Propionigenium maris DSM 9537]
MEEIKNFELIDSGRKNINRAVTERDIDKGSVLDMEPTKWETIWNVSLILTAYVGMGILLGVKLILEIVKYLMGYF